jgi:transmembrane sensor
MSGLRLPLKGYLQDSVDEAALHRIAEGIDSPAQPSHTRKSMPFVWGGALAAGIVIAIVSRGHGRHDTGPLAFADGREFVAVDARDRSREVSLSDGSSIRLWPGAHIEPLESSSNAFSAIVTQGRADFEVRPGGPRHWTVECGLATVEVVGTAFSCDRSPGRLRVEVQHGVVLIRGERVPDRARRLSAGERFDITERPLAATSVASPVVDPSAVPVASVSPAAVAEPSAKAETREGVAKSSPAPARAWRELARRGHNQEAYAALGVEGIRNESKKLGVNDLLALADVARLSGHPVEAVVPLQRILAEFSGDAQAPLAAFALGRLELDSLGHARAAVAAFRKALALGIPHGLREDVLSRLVEACASSGDSAGAKRAADAYLDEFPNGRYAKAVQAWSH